MKHMHETRARFYGWAFIILYFGLNTIYGWNRDPQSTIEVITDGLTVFVLVMWMQHKSTLNVIESIEQHESTEIKS